MKTITLKKLFTFILLLCGMFSFTDLFSQCSVCIPLWFPPTCPSGEVWARRWGPNCTDECGCINVHHVNSWRNKGCRQCGCGCSNRLSDGQNIEAASLSVYPNPASGPVTISFYVEQTENVKLKIFDVSERLIATLANASFEEGDYEFVWDVSNVNAGIYFLRMETATYSENQKLVVTK